MFGTDIKLITFIFILIEIVIASSLVTIYLSRVREKGRLRIIILTCLYILYNFTSGLMPDENINISTIVQNLMTYGSGALLASYFFYYLSTELKLYQAKTFKVRYLIIGLLILFLVCFGAFYFIKGDMVITKKTFAIGASILAIIYCVQTIINLLKKLKDSTRDTIPTKTMIIAGNLSIIFMTTMPMVAFFDNVQELNHLLVNISLFLILYAYYKHLYYQNKKRQIIEDGLVKVKKFDLDTFLYSYKFTKSEIELAKLILEKITFREMGERLNNAPNSLTSKASTCYRKIGCANKKEFIEIIERVRINSQI